MPSIKNETQQNKKLTLILEGAKVYGTANSTGNVACLPFSSSAFHAHRAWIQDGPPHCNPPLESRRRLHTALSPAQSFMRPFHFWFTWMTTSFSCGSSSQGFTFLWLQDSEENDHSSKTLVQPLKCWWIKYENIPHSHSHPSYRCFAAR